MINANVIGNTELLKDCNFHAINVLLGASGKPATVLRFKTNHF